MICYVFSACETGAEREARLLREEQKKIELAKKRKAEEDRIAKQLEQERLERQAKLEKERKEKEIYDRWIT